MMKTVLLIGPYIGDWKNEIKTFWPYAKWIYEQLDRPTCFISSHSNRKFLYDWIPDQNFIPVFEHLTRNEEKQNNYIHDSIDSKDYKILIKEFKKSVVDDDITNKQILLYHLPYLESKPNISWYQKKFFKMSVKPVYNDYIIYIPDNSITEKENLKIHEHLRSNYDNVIMMGDHNCTSLHKCLNFQIDYTENGYKMLIEYLLGCKLVICPSSVWTHICNLHKIPVISWGLNARIYKRENIYGFDNPYNYILIDDSIEKLYNAIKFQIRRIENDL